MLGNYTVGTSFVSIIRKWFIWWVREILEAKKLVKRQCRHSGWEAIRTRTVEFTLKMEISIWISDLRELQLLSLEFRNFVLTLSSVRSQELIINSFHLKLSIWKGFISCISHPLPDYGHLQWPSSPSVPVPLFRPDRRCPSLVRLLRSIIIIRESYSLFMYICHLMMVELHGFQHVMFRYIVLFSFNHMTF